MAKHRMGRPRRPGRALVARVTAVVLIVGGCRPAPAPDPLDRIPALLIEGPALMRLLERLASLTDTPAARVSARLHTRLAGCPEVVARFPDPLDARAPFDALDALQCRATPSSVVTSHPDDAARSIDPTVPREPAPATRPEPVLLARLDDARSGHAGALQWPIGRAGRLALTLDVDANGGLALAGRLVPDDAMGPAGFLVPSPTAPRPAVVDAGSALLHLHLRSATGTGLARLIPKEGQGDRLFALKSRLLEGALLEGTLELALLEPAPANAVPLAAIVLHHRGAAAIAAALAEALAQLRHTWSLEPSPRVFATRSGSTRTGGCYANLPLLPELAPCWVVTDEALVLGYRAEAVAAVLGSSTPASPPPQRAGESLPRVSAAAPSDAHVPARDTDVPAAAPATRLVVDLDRMRTLDTRLTARPVAGEATRAARPTIGARATRLGDLYDRLELSATAGADGIALSGLLRARR
ncbi:MAG: hypothetical protein R3F35_05425 [Myxococcota bacterium]